MDDTKARLIREKNRLIALSKETDELALQYKWVTLTIIEILEYIEDPVAHPNCNVGTVFPNQKPEWFPKCVDGKWV